MEELWIGKALIAGIVLALAIGLVFMVTGLIQKVQFPHIIILKKNP